MVTEGTCSHDLFTRHRQDRVSFSTSNDQVTIFSRMEAALKATLLGDRVKMYLQETTGRSCHKNGRALGGDDLVS